MRKLKLGLFVCVCLPVFFIDVCAQESVLSSGGLAKGAGGSLNYSVGQVFFTTQVGDKCSVSQGAQQPFEFYVTTGINRREISLSMGVYPNPSTDFVNLKVGDLRDKVLEYHLIDLDGKLLDKGRIQDDVTRISMESLPKAMYFLSVVRNGQLIKSFKIVKN